ncbi:MAG: L-threonylcarbamoyladenylate synthase [Methanobacteriota archaeon]
MVGPKEYCRSQIYDDTLRDMAAQGLARGEVAIYPTDTLYALGASAHSEHGVQRVAELKGRPLGMPMSFAFPDIESILIWTEPSQLAKAVMEQNLPGPLTIVLPANEEAPKYIVNADGTLGVRIPDDEVIRMLLADAGPLSATSANLHGGKDPNSMRDVPKELLDKVDRVIDFGPCKHRGCSTVIKIIGDDITLLREGVIPLRELKR